MAEYVTEILDHGPELGGDHSYSFGACREEVVRCRDCGHYSDHGDVGVCRQPCGDATCGFAWATPDGFCAWGERREEGSNGQGKDDLRLHP